VDSARLQGRAKVLAILSQGRRLGDAGILQQEEGLGIGGSEGLEELQLSRLRRVELLRCDDGIDRDPGPEDVFRQGIRDPVQVRPQLVDPEGIDAEAGRQLVSAVADHQVGGSIEGLAKMESGHGASGALGGAIIEESGHERRPVGIVFEPAGDDADHAFVPLLTHHHQDSFGLWTGGGQLPGLDEDALLLFPPLGVESVQLLGKHPGFASVFGQHKAKRMAGVGDPADGIDSRSDLKADAPGGDVPARTLEAADGEKLDEPGLSGVGEPLKAEAGDDPVLPPERHHVCDGAEGGQIDEGVADPINVLPQLPSQPGAELPGDSGSAEVGKGIAAVGAVRIDHRIRDRERVLRKVMVGDDRHHSGLLDRLHLLVGGDAAIAGEKEARAEGHGVSHGLRMDAIAPLDPMGDIGVDLEVHPLQESGKDGRAGDAIHIVVAMHEHQAPFASDLQKGMDGGLEVGQEPRIGKLGVGGADQLLGLCGVGPAPCGQDGSGQRPETQLTAEPGLGFGIARARLPEGFGPGGDRHQQARRRPPAPLRVRPFPPE
jgi:hypothetical protein